jgi:hypothetical protein
MANGCRILDFRTRSHALAFQRSQLKLCHFDWRVLQSIQVRLEQESFARFRCIMDGTLSEDKTSLLSPPQHFASRRRRLVHPASRDRSVPTEEHHGQHLSTICRAIMTHKTAPSDT